MEELLTQICDRLASLENEVKESREENRALRAMLADEGEEAPEVGDSHFGEGVAIAAGDSLPHPISQPLPLPQEAMPRLLPQPHPLDPEGVSRERQLKLTPPDRYSGDPSLCRHFLTQCDLHFLGKPSQFPTPRAKVLFMVSNLSGEALRWASPLIERRDPLIDSYVLFEQRFRKMFDRRVTPHMRSLELLNIRQGSNDLVAYINRFQHCTAEVECAEPTQYAVFLQGLREEIREGIQAVYPMPATLGELQDLALQVDLRLRERGTQQRFFRKTSLPSFTSPWGPTRSDSPTSKPRAEPGVKGVSTSAPSTASGGGSRSAPGSRVFPPGTVPRAPLSEEEKARRRRENLCMYCGKPGHQVAECRLVRFPAVPQTVAGNLEPIEPPTQEQGKDLAQAESGPPAWAPKD